MEMGSVRNGKSRYHPIYAALVLGLCSVLPVRSAALPGKLTRQVSGVELKKLVIGTTMTYGNPPARSGLGSIFQHDGKYIFVIPEVQGPEGHYWIEDRQVCAEAIDVWCFTVFDYRGVSYIFTPARPADGYRAVKFTRIK